MKLKSELYKKEQKQIIQQIINILELDENNSITLYELDNDEGKKKKIMNLVPKIRTYFSFSDIKGVSNPSSLKRPWLSIIRQLTKEDYKMISKDIWLKKESDVTRSKIYFFNKKISVLT